MFNSEMFEQSLQAEIEQFNKQKNHPKGILPLKKTPVASEAEKVPSKQSRKKSSETKKPWRPKPKPNHHITLRVRKKPLGVDEEFEHKSFCVAKLDAELDARKAAEAAGYPIHTYIIDWETKD